MDSIQRRAGMLVRARGEVLEELEERCRTWSAPGKGSLGEHKRELCQLLAAAPDWSLGGPAGH